ncbi:hypothetical protein HN807_00890 [Candidatus Bathyarchaeota archaeon]|mgnify:FL=1|jgi:hypothetical protein|nr:hypothetical protein [Candidatus Bathyarchaeota archaeon]MBT4319702.1 hypothetical protein [Candidatus Bathyarchaeota archaeon]MBT4424615.1 hypothetical protein [Candidatus Bathyarchaeota archaeon]MBT5641557.1 hypothetical protein [Candidatus Bathyarchaeota archaeon]MBT6604400.1 hypothetical protein [Candidatus Bathyarchaeota archaeon]
MERRLPVSKPLLLVIIGLIIGLSLGLGSGYAVFYPNMVNERSRTIEGQVMDVEEDVAGLGVSLDSMNRSIAVIGDSLEGILALTDIIDGVSDRVTTIENGQVTLNSELDDVEDTLNQLNEDFVTLDDDWDGVVNEFADLISAYNSMNIELKAAQDLVRENDGIRIFTAYMANPSSYFKEAINDEVYALLVLESQDFSEWATLVGLNSANIILLQDIDTLMGTLVWNPTNNTEVGDNSYQVKLETYFPFEFDPASVSINKIRIEVRATINLETQVITLLQIGTVEVV